MPFKVDKIAEGYRVFTEENTLVMEILTPENAILPMCSVTVFVWRKPMFRFEVPEQNINKLGVEKFAKQVLCSLKTDLHEKMGKINYAFDGVINQLQKSYPDEDYYVAEANRYKCSLDF